MNEWLNKLRVYYDYVANFCGLREDFSTQELFLIFLNLKLAHWGFIGQDWKNIYHVTFPWKPFLRKFVTHLEKAIRNIPWA